MNTKALHEIVKGTLDGLPFAFKATKAEWLLVGMTFGAETDFYREEPDKFKLGMMGMQREEFLWFIKDHVKPNEKYNNFIFNMTMVDLNSFSWESIEFAAKYNIAFQVAVTYLWYFLKCNRPETVNDAVHMYMDFWKGKDKKSKERAKRALVEYTDGMKTIHSRELE